MGKWKSVGFFSHHRNQFTLFSLRRMSLQVRPNLFHVLHHAVQLEIELLDLSVGFAVADLQRDSLIVQAIRFVVAFGRVCTCFIR